MAGYLCLLATALLWSTAGALVKYLPWNAFAIAGFRGLFSMLLLMGFRAARHRSGIKGALPRLSAANLRIGLFMFLTSTCYTLSIKLTTAANAIVLQYIAPVLVLLYAMCFEAKKPGARSVLLTFVVFGGCVLTFASQLSPAGALGNGIALMSGAALAGQVIASRKAGADPADGLIIGSAASFLLFSPLLLLEPRSSFTSATIAAGLFLGLFQYGLANVCYARGIARTDEVSASLLLTLEPVLTPIWVYLTTGERPSGLAVAGFVCVVGAAIAQSVLSARGGSMYSIDG